MTFLKFNKIEQVQPAKWTGNDPFDPQGNLGYFSFADEERHDPETGTLTISTDLIRGKLMEVEEIWLVCSTPFRVELKRWEMKTASNGVDLDIDFRAIFKHGLLHTANLLLESEMPIVGLTRQEKEALKTWDGQKALLEILTLALLPNRQQEILALAVPAYKFQPAATTDQSLLGGGSNSFAGYLSRKEAMKLVSLDLRKVQIQGVDLPQKMLMISLDGTGESLVPKVFITDQESLAKNDENTPEEYFSTYQWTPTLDLPPEYHSAWELLALNEVEDLRYFTLLETYRAMAGCDPGDGHKLFGYPDALQDCVALAAVQKARGNADASITDALQWHLLLQLSSDCQLLPIAGDDRVGDSWLYFMIEKTALAREDFSNVQLILQCT